MASSRPLRLFVIAGEPSGDVLGADLVRRLRETVDVELLGVGGPELEGEGLKSLFPMNELAVMGWADVLPRMPLLLWRARQTARALVRANADIAVFIDAQVFSAKVAGHVRRAGARLPIVLYVSPTVWLWRPERAAKLVGLFDEVLAILPFEPGVMAGLGGPPTQFVGHPALDRAVFRPEVPEKGPLLLLPGSRVGELRRHMPLMRAMAERFSGHPRITRLVLPTIGALEARVRSEVASWRAPVDVLVKGADKRAAFSGAIAGVAVVGTVTLELAATGIPMVVVYAPDKGQQERILKHGVRHLALPNIILGRDVVPESVAAVPDEKVVGNMLARVLDEPAEAAGQLEGFLEMRERMRVGTPDYPRVGPETRILALAKRD